MKTLTINERINFKSHFPVGGQLGVLRVLRVDHYGWRANTDSNNQTFEIPYWQELQSGYFTPNSAFRNKF